MILYYLALSCLTCINLKEKPVHLRRDKGEKREFSCTIPHSVLHDRKKYEKSYQKNMERCKNKPFHETEEAFGLKTALF
ncbi:hypothetical protein SAMN05216383_11069 [Prevotella sp. KH2C16]|nr:hypothetical protein SAMN05216383_11069 [Prevotella sp. KH2C16]